MTPTIPAAVATALANARQLATLPEVTQEVLRLVDDPATTGDDLSRVLKRDPTLSARILRVVNSAAYGMRREVASIDAAIVVLGFAAVRNVAMAASFSRFFAAPEATGPCAPRDVWRHSVAVAAAARRLAAGAPDIDPEEALLAGLLHDIGLILAMQGLPDAWSRFVQALSADPDARFAECERTHLGATHSEFGEALCTEWRFPARLRAAVAHHHEPVAASPADAAFVATIALADRLAVRAGIGVTRTGTVDPPDAALLAQAGISDEAAAAAAEALPADVAALLPQLAGD